MNSNVEIILLSVILFTVTFSFGWLPTMLYASQKCMNLIAIFGAGLLVGAALMVIVPEGMEILFNSLTKYDKSSENILEPKMDPNFTLYVGISLVFGFMIMLLLD